jgi:acyl-coenzyme A synthetase/AMP-(fatty) acid ligase
LLTGPADRTLVWADGRRVSAARFLAGASELATRLPGSAAMINLCEGRREFLLAFGAAMLRGQTTLLPPSRAPTVIEEIRSEFPGAWCCDDEFVAGGEAAAATADFPGIAGEFEAIIAFTSGTTGRPRPQRKRWSAVSRTTALNAQRIRDAMAGGAGGAAGGSIVATVPAQHMFGMETSVLLPLLAGFSVHEDRPLFPADVAAALAAVAPPRILVTTPVHLRALTAAGVAFPAVALIVAATAPLDEALAHEAEAAFAAPLLDFLGSTETCVIAAREPARGQAWQLYEGVTLVPRPDGTAVEAPWFDAPAELQDLVELLPGGQFVLKGRNSDMIEIAGKRASLAELTRRLLAVPGVLDAVVFQPDATGGAARVARVSALVVAPGRSAAEIIAALRMSVDEAFLPRPLALVAALPRSATGKLPRSELMGALK